MSSLFGPRYYATSEPNFGGLFRLIDEFDKHASGGQSSEGRRALRQVQTFSPSFDLKETDDAFELHGDLPGLEKRDCNIDFTDDQHLRVSGRVERSYTTGSKGDEDKSHLDHHTQQQQISHKPTVEDDTEDGGDNKTTTVAKTSGNGHGSGKEVSSAKSGGVAKGKYWITERSVGEFSRVFSFPSRVDTEGVKATLKDGVLSITVPKAKKHESRRVAIS